MTAHIRSTVLTKLEHWADNQQRLRLRSVTAMGWGELSYVSAPEPAVQKRVTVNRFMGTTSVGNFMGTQKEPPTACPSGNGDVIGKPMVLLTQKISLLLAAIS